MNTTPKEQSTKILRDLETQHSMTLLEAGRAPAGSDRREALLKKAEALLKQINAICEELNPTPLA